jgi:carbon storage regulator CsrA
MLVLSRKQHESIVVGGTVGCGLFVKVIVLEVKNGVVKLGFDASPDVLIHRLEVWDRIQGGMSVRSA